MNGTNTKNIGLYDADTGKEVLLNGTVIKRKGQKAPKNTIIKDGISVFFAQGYEDTLPFREQLSIAFIDASKDGAFELRGVGYGKNTISIEVH